ncbi:quinone-dependent dihydroorotate dehydrogenase [Staphylococcus pettenkoferi]|uniref:quinone-dependent dihydroorotate dehydrogenase n=1 Tax=Staphylococcus pettenkoferi TaxID=170573 RepID=UPI0022734FAB|nr:quinone-dependent dihydroorotate dehydrogenase [Staphylococcus pettenkoferi]MCY1567600.1 quinone-dependent dihydroorotate dehydrogenase [Staphylococcus pettenkoferi]MCY1588944.1 quinone-dependent dihydroorotate dehydrogenase [Staphylococcus pettenkoferi]MCY1604723.1 quinone-dependent dihydroorotate dehydrogenase [Staphylococcus pettenkoferi]
MYKLIKPILFKMDPEQAHGRMMRALKIVQKHPNLLSMIDRIFHYKNEMLAQDVAGIHFTNPVGLAAGFDKSCEVPKALQYSGFGALELGGITPKPQPGNPKPRMYRLPEDRALINRMGFNNIGMNKALSNLRRHSYELPIGINVGVNKMTAYEERYQDYIKVLDTFKNDATFFTINISSPNTANLQNFHDKDEFSMLTKAIKDYRENHELSQPIFLKLTSDLELEGFKHILDPIVDTFDGVVLANTTQQRDGLQSENRSEGGGLSGRPLFERHRDLVRWAYQQTKGTFPIIATGGIFSAEDAIEMMRNGASLVQIYSSLVYEGPGLTAKINKDIVKYLKQHGYHNVSDLIGLDA